MNTSPTVIPVPSTSPVKTPKIKRVCIFCGSHPGSRPEYLQEASELGILLAREKVGIVYGAGNSGLMGALADAALAENGEVIGVTPDVFLQQGLIHLGLSRLHVVKTMHQRKAMMAKLSDAFIALPGGYGTMEELFEVITWMQLGFHHKPIALLNTCGYYDNLAGFLDHMLVQGFILPQNRQLLIIESDPASLFQKITRFQL
jgi:uncharacterized protein (TIGR00730 family)